MMHVDRRISNSSGFRPLARIDQFTLKLQTKATFGRPPVMQRKATVDHPRVHMGGLRRPSKQPLAACQLHAYRWIAYIIYSVCRPLASNDDDEYVP